MEMGIYVQRIHTRMFTEALFVTIKAGNNTNMTTDGRM